MGGAWTPGLTQTCTPHLPFRILIKMKSKWLAPLPLYFSGWIVTSLDSKRPHNSLTVTFRRHFTEIIFVLIYRKLSSTLQECHFKVPSIQLHPPPLSLLLLLTSSEDAQRSALVILPLLCYGSLHTICEKWQCHIRPLLFCQAAPAQRLLIHCKLPHSTEKKKKKLVLAAAEHRLKTPVRAKSTYFEEVQVNGKTLNHSWQFTWMLKRHWGFIF